jgi:hypothetical protein
MKGIQGLTATKWLVVAFLASFFFAGAAQAQGQLPAFAGKFTLPYEVHWGNSVLPPGDYSLTIKSKGTPMIALVRTADGEAVTYVMNGAVETHPNGQNALLIKERRGQRIVHSLALNDLGVVLIYDPSLAHEKPLVQEARNIQAVPVTSGKK